MASNPAVQPTFLYIGHCANSFVATVIALAAGNVVKHHHPVTELKILHAFAHRGDLAGHLVPENARRGMGPVEIFFKSVPQIPQVCMRTSISPAPISGTGTVSIRTSFWPRYTAARISVAFNAADLNSALLTVSI